VPGNDDRLEHAFRNAARQPTLDGVAEGVHAKWSRRRTIRRVERAAFAGALAASVIVVAVVALDTTRSDQHVTVAPARGAIPVVRVDGEAVRRGAIASVRVEPDEGYVRGPLLTSGDRVAMAAYDRDGTTYSFPPSRIVRIEADGTVVDRIDLQGEILSLADGEGARWALTRDKTVVGPEDPEFRVKRIGPDGVVASNAVPPGEQPVGRIAAGGGGVWVPVIDGVLRFDSVTGAFAGKIPLATTTDRRAVVASGKFVFATDGLQEVRLDPASDEPAGPVATLSTGFEIVDAANADLSGAAYLLVRGDGDTWLVSDGENEVTLPRDFEATGIFAAGSVVWVDGSSAGVRTVLVIEPRASRISIGRTLRLDNTSDLSITFTSPRNALIASAGEAYGVKLPK
jgi:hypothetical protein